MRPVIAKACVVMMATVWGLLGACGLLVAPFTVFLFDTPEAAHNVATIILALSVLSFPITCGIAVILALVALWGKNSLRTSRYYLLLPLASLTLILAASLWIELVQGGRLSG